MNENFLVRGRWYKTPCETVLTADTFTVQFFTGKHTIIANVLDKCYFVSIDNITLSDIKCDFHFSRNYTKPKEFLSNLYDTFDSFLNTSIPFSERHFPHSIDDVIRRILELVQMKKEQFEIVSESATETEPETETETTTDKDDTTVPETIEPESTTTTETSEATKKPIEIRTKFYLLESFFLVNVKHYYVELMTDDKKFGDFYLYLKFDENGNEEKAMCKIFHLNAEYRNYDFETHFLYALAEKYNGLYCTPDYDDFAYYKKIAEECKTPETFEPFMYRGEKCFYISPLEKIKQKSEINNKKKAINSMYGITANTTSEISNEYDETKELLAVEQFERLTGTLYKSLFKAIGLEETRRIPFIISNNMVFFNYNGTQYKYNPAQCKVYKKDGRKYQRMNWKDFKDDNSSADQKQARGRSPPFTPDMRSTTIQ